MKHVAIYTDGACRGNPGPGGWGAVLVSGEEVCELQGASPMTTNNRMELMAAIEGLKALTEASLVDVTTDSEYVRQGITAWIQSWKRRGWKTAANQPVKNQELWQALDVQAARHTVTWHWVKGHSGHFYNERADTLARLAIDAVLT